MHSTFNQKAFEATMSSGLAFLEQGLEKSTKWVLSEIFNMVPKWFLVSEHIAMEITPAW